MVDDVDNQGSFKMFDAGWILPSGQRRGGRQPVERLPLPKKMRLDRGVSKLSAFSTLASENQILETTPQFEDAAGPSGLSASEKGDVAMDVDVPPDHEAQTSTSTNIIRPDDQPLPSITIPNAKIISEHGRLVIEELDTPATRREKARLRKAEKLREAAQALAPASQLPSTENVTSILREDESDLSSLSDLESEEGHDAEKPENEADSANKEYSSVVPPTADGLVSNPSTEPGVIVLDKGKKLEGGTLVWAKADTYPWWPAVVYEPDDPRVPKVVLKQQEIKRRTEDGPLHLVQFYDKLSQWQWFETSKLLHLGEDEALDKEMIATTSKRQRWKTKTMRKDCQEAYYRAKAEMETEETGDEAPAQEAPVSA
ncbi:hypothetical protein BV22DRAFT_1123793 [Leucogyrophana mollusca]|uniref:Uncharacterized protein n=1 Tax=Leucogyrophana mollusca TaxID=85980 RepID=A0ACB8AY20_9AGAM|nr:hypothetical protein BV22DRAFT_1123793 [Leucogyrophana mollusca]